ncbi:MAG: 5-formyltetrahydrofolate cyclo-ligase [Rhodospirillaceae bacterium]
MISKDLFDNSITATEGPRSESKAQLRRRYMILRAAMKGQTKSADTMVKDQIIKLLADQPLQAVAGYIPMKNELNLMPTLLALHTFGMKVCVPVCHEELSELTFRQWTPNSELISGPFGTVFPHEAEEAVQPDLLLVPLVVFDCEGNRIGFGQGYYDRTLSALRKQKNIAAYGVAFDQQEAPAVPHDDYDARLDGIITPTRKIIVNQTHTYQS